MRRAIEIWWSGWVLIYVLGIALYVLGAACGLASGQPPLTITQSGYYITVVDSTGVPSLVQLTEIVDLRDSTDDPDPPPSDKPEVDAELVKCVQALANETGDPMGAQAIAAVYSHVRLAVADGIVSTTDVWPISKTSTDLALAIASGGKDWSGFRKKISDEISDRKSQGQLESARDIQRVMLSIQHGLELSADGSTALSTDQLVRIASETNRVIDSTTEDK